MFDTDRIKTFPITYRILHVDGGRYWTGQDWRGQGAARLYTAEERQLAALPFRGCWEVAHAPILYEQAVRR